jgi:hypothetical protein
MGQTSKKKNQRGKAPPMPRRNEKENVEANIIPEGINRTRAVTQATQKRGEAAPGDSDDASDDSSDEEEPTLGGPTAGGGTKDNGAPMTDENGQKWAATVTEEIGSKLECIYEERKSEMEAIMDKKIEAIRVELWAKMKAEVSEVMEGKKKEMLDADLQRRNVVKDLTKEREDKGGFNTAKEMTEDPQLKGHLTR